MISLDHVKLKYPGSKNYALDDINIHIEDGEFVFIVGHSGSGKSTFIRLLTRELRASKGKVLVAGQDLTRMRNWKVPYLRRQIGCVFQDFKLLPDKTITSGMGIPFHNPRYAKDIFPLTTHQFEDKEFPVPYNADALLRRLYGDYMQLPDLSKLKLHVSKLDFYDD